MGQMWKDLVFAFLTSLCQCCLADLSYNRYQTLTSGKLSSTANFQAFADLTASVASTLYDADARQTVVDAWAGVGITVTGEESGGDEL